MLFPTLLTQAAEDMAWTGEVKAFAYYATAECLPEERLATVYVARKLYEDGSTVTIVRNVPNDRNPTLRSGTIGEGRIERDPSGLVTRLDASTVGRPHGGSYSAGGTHVGRSGGGAWHVEVKRAAQPLAVMLNRLVLQLDLKTGMLAGSWDTPNANSRLEFVQPRAYWLDPLEAIAFGSPASMAAGWLLPSGTASFVENRSRVVGMMLVPTAKGAFALEMNGVREAFRRIDLISIYPGAVKTFPPPPPGSLLFHADGRLAAYVPGLGIMDSPGTVFTDGYSTRFENRETAPPPFALKGKLKDLWDKGIDVRQDHVGSFGLFAPAPVSFKERATVLASIPAPQPPSKPTEIDKAPPADG